MVKKIGQIIIGLTLLLSLIACQFESVDEPIEENPNEEIPDDGDEDIMHEIKSFNNHEQSIDEILGVTFWGGRYLPGLQESESSIERAADEILTLGSKVIKVAAGNLVAQYPLDTWDLSSVSYAVDKLKLAPFINIFNKPLKTYFISIPEYNTINWRDGVDDAEKQYVNDEFYRITKYLLETYKNTGKTFILQNWESDNYIGPTTDTQIMSNFTTYMNARQDGVNRARSEIIMSESNNVFVFNAIEINRLTPSANLRVVDEVIPNTYFDLYLYSSYEAKDKGVVSDVNDVKFKLFDLLLYYKSKLPKASNYPQTMYFGENRLAISEFGYPDYADQYQGLRQKMVSQGHLLTQGPLKLQYLVYWALTDNEVIGDNKQTIASLSPNELRNYGWKPGDLNGFYLIRPDGIHTYTYEYFKAVLNTNNIMVEATIPEIWKQ